jgi:hypothetical protein
MPPTGAVAGVLAPSGAALGLSVASQLVVEPGQELLHDFTGELEAAFEPLAWAAHGKPRAFKEWLSLSRCAGSVTSRMVWTPIGWRDRRCERLPHAWCVRAVR